MQDNSMKHGKTKTIGKKKKDKKENWRIRFQHFEISPQLNKLTNGISAALKFSKARAL